MHELEDYFQEDINKLKVGAAVLLGGIYDTYMVPYKRLHSEWLTLVYGLGPTTLKCIRRLLYPYFQRTFEDHQLCVRLYWLTGVPEETQMILFVELERSFHPRRLSPRPYTDDKQNPWRWFDEEEET